MKSLLSAAFALLLAWGGGMVPSLKGQCQINEGVLDLRNCGFQKDQVVKLDGQWRSSWGELVRVQDSLPGEQFGTIPDNWQSFTNRPFWFKQFGHVTYELRILFPETDAIWALYLPPIHSAYKVFMGEELLTQVGIPTKGVDMTPGVKTQVVPFDITGKEARLRIQVSNYHFVSGGIGMSILLGEYKTVNRLRINAILYSAFLIGGMILLGLYHLGIYLFWQQERGTLYICLLCLFLALRESFGAEALFFHLFPHLPYTIALKLLYGVFPAALIVLTMFFESIFPSYSKFMRQLSLWSGLTILSVIFLTPNPFYAQIIPLLYGLFLVKTIYWVTLITRSREKVRKENLVFLVTIVVAVVCCLNDLLFAAGKIQSYFLLPSVFLILVLGESFVLALRFLSAFDEQQKLNLELKNSNEAYEKLTVERNEVVEAKEVEEMKNRYFANISHEFRTPLTLIIGPLQSLITGDPTKRNVKHQYEIILRNSNRLLRLINQLLDLSKLDARAMKLTAAREDFVIFLLNIMASFEAQAKMQSIDLSFEADVESCQLYFDREKMEKIMINLLGNAFKYTKNGGRIECRFHAVGQDPNWVTLSLRDNGMGIPVHDLEHIFKRYYQTNMADVQGKSGSGLGLALVKELVVLHKGKIEVNSTAGDGTEFKMYLQIGKDHLDGKEIVARNRSYWPKTDSPYGFPSEIEDKVPPRAKEEKENTVTECNILIVEDNPDMQDYLTGILQNQYQLLIASNGHKGLDLAEQEVELIISDIMMPEMDGLTFCRKIKENRKTCHIPVILLTAKAGETEKIIGLETGADDYLTKPFSPIELRTRVRNLITQRRILFEKFRTHVSLQPKDIIVNSLDQQFLQNAISIVEEHMEDSHFGVGDLCQHLGFGNQYVSRKLKGLVAQTPSSFILSIRLRRAAQLLLKPHMKVTEAMFAVGLDNHSYFSKKFREQFDISPSKFIKSKREK